MSIGTRRVSFLALISLLPACPFCDDVNQFLPQGSIEPAVLDLGPVTTGTTCPAKLGVKNGGNADLEVTGGSAALKDQNGDFTIQKVPSLVRLGATEELLVNYTAGDATGEREGTNIEIVTNDADDDGKLRASITAFVAAEPVALARAECDGAATDDGFEVVSPCTELSFGAVPIGDPVLPIEQRPGSNLTLRVLNDGNKDLIVTAALIDGGNGDFAVVGARRGSQVVPFPVTVPPGRTGDCGDLTGADNVVSIDVRFAPVNLGAAIATVSIITDAEPGEGELIEVAVSGLGADTGLLTDPTIVRFGDVAEGTLATQVVRVSNIGTSEASVNESCIDLEGDGVCDGLCTAAAADATLGGTLSCEVKRSDGAHEGKGFVLDATDAVAGGNDERTVELHWTPSAADPAIPSTAVLLLKSNVEGNRVYEVGIVGSNLGVLEVSSATPCGENECVAATGTTADVTTWSGSLTLTLTNGGDASLTISGVAAEAGTPGTIVDDWTIGAPVTSTIAPGASTTLVLGYANLDCSVDPCVAEDFSGQDGFNLIVSHNGAQGETLVGISVLPPP